MLFNRKASYFLDLSSDEGAGSRPEVKAVVAPVKAEPARPAAQASAEAKTETKVAASQAPAVAAAEASAPAAGSLTTAEAIAAELAAAEAGRPPLQKATFAPECLTPGGSPLPRRRGGGPRRLPRHGPVDDGSLKRFR